jgi:hypothetical protein
MKRICCFLIACLAVSACLLYAADFWEKKEFTSWSEDEVSKLFRDSPWAHKADVALSENESKTNPVERHAYNLAKAGGLEDRDLMRASGTILYPDDELGSWTTTNREYQRMVLNGLTGDLGGFFPPVILRWHSALPVKQAVAVLRYKDKAGTSEEAAEMINRKESAYILGVIGMRWFGPIDEFWQSVFKAGSQLIVEGKPPIRAIGVYANQDGENSNLYIAFPRYRNNAPLISLEDKKVEVVIEFGLGYSIYKIKKEFNLKDMQYRGKLEI